MSHAPVGAFSVLLDVLVAVGTVVAAGAAVWAAFESRRAAKRSEVTATAAIEALSAALRPVFHISQEAREMVLSVEGEHPAVDVVAWYFRRGPMVATISAPFMQPMPVFDAAKELRVEIDPGELRHPDTLVDRAVVECVDFRRVGRWRYHYALVNHAAAWNLHQDAFEWQLVHIEYVGAVSALHP
jgi:hypothetical protein